jgi:DNA mismatch repair protein MSH5
MVKTIGSRINIITGANNSGKTVYLKQVGLIVFMTHIGSFVPCQNAIIGITDKIMTRIQSHDSVSVDQSTFGSDLLQINTMVKTFSEKSLLLIDEFGKGNDNDIFPLYILNELTRNTCT